MTCFAVVWTTWAYDDKCSILSSNVPSAGSNLIPGWLEHILSLIHISEPTRRVVISYAVFCLKNVVHTPAKLVIPRRGKNENVYKMSKNEKCTCKACKNTVFHCQICKFGRFLLPSSSWFLKLPNISNMRKSVSSDIQTLRSGLKKGCAAKFFNQLRSV